MQSAYRADYAGGVQLTGSGFRQTQRAFLGKGFGGAVSFDASLAKCFAFVSFDANVISSHVVFRARNMTVSVLLGL